MEETLCISCKKKNVNDEGNTRFKCPRCSASEILRCHSCRVIAAKYTCPSCNFTGPN